MSTKFITNPALDQLAKKNLNMALASNMISTQSPKTVKVKTMRKKIMTKRRRRMEKKA